MEENNLQKGKMAVQNHSKNSVNLHMEISSELVPDFFGAEEKSNAHKKWLRHFKTNVPNQEEIER